MSGEVVSLKARRRRANQQAATQSAAEQALALADSFQLDQTALSSDLGRWSRSTGHTATEEHLLRWIATESRPDEPWTYRSDRGVAGLAADLWVSLPAVYNAIKRLTDEGLLEIDKGDKQRARRIVLRIPWHAIEEILQDIQLTYDVQGEMEWEDEDGDGHN